MEMLKIKDPAQRRSIANVMEELTDFATIVGRDIVMECELRAMLDPLAKEPDRFPAVSLIGRGAGHAAGWHGQFKIAGRSEEDVQRVRQLVGPAALDEFVEQANLLLERSMLRGPDDLEVEDLRRFGWNPEAIVEVAERRAAEERAQSARLDGETRWRRGLLRDLVSTRELTIEFQDMLPRVLAERGLELEDVLSNQASARAFVRAMPSTEVAIELLTSWHRSADKQWTANDIYDIDSMAIAIPYCDIVVTEKACHHALVTAGLGVRMHTAILRSLGDLPSALEKWEPTRRPT
jgi:hypothetical protein